MADAQREYQVNLRGVRTMDAFVSAFNEGLIFEAGGRWNGNWNAFNDYLCWPAERSYVLVLAGWTECEALRGYDLEAFEDILATSPHVSVRRT